MSVLPPNIIDCINTGKYPLTLTAPSIASAAEAEQGCTSFAHAYQQTFCSAHIVVSVWNSFLHAEAGAPVGRSPGKVQLRSGPHLLVGDGSRVPFNWRQVSGGQLFADRQDPAKTGEIPIFMKPLASIRQTALCLQTHSGYQSNRKC